MHRLHHRALPFALLALGLLPCFLSGQESPPPSPQEVEALRRAAEALEVQRERLTLLFIRVVEENPELSERIAAYDVALEQAVDEILPEAPQHRARLAELEAAYDEALFSGEEVDFDAMLEEGRELDRALRNARREAGERPELARMSQDMEAEIMRRATELDPEAQQLTEQERQLRTALWIRLLEQR